MNNYLSVLYVSPLVLTLFVVFLAEGLIKHCQVRLPMVNYVEIFQRVLVIIRHYLPQGFVFENCITPLK